MSLPPWMRNPPPAPPPATIKEAERGGTRRLAAGQAASVQQEQDARLAEIHRLFALEYLANGGDGKAAAKKVGIPWSRELLAHRHVQAALEAAGHVLAERLPEAMADVQRVMRELAYAGLSDIGECFDPATGELLPVPKMPERIRRALGAVEIGREGQVKVKLLDKLRALELIGKQHGMFKEQAEVNVHLLDSGERERRILQILERGRLRMLAAKAAGGEGESHADGDGEQAGS